MVSWDSKSSLSIPLLLNDMSKLTKTTTVKQAAALQPSSAQSSAPSAQTPSKAPRKRRRRRNIVLRHIPAVITVLLPMAARTTVDRRMVGVLPWVDCILGMVRRNTRSIGVIVGVEAGGLMTRVRVVVVAVIVMMIRGGDIECVSWAGSHGSRVGDG